MSFWSSVVIINITKKILTFMYLYTTGLSPLLEKVMKQM